MGFIYKIINTDNEKVYIGQTRRVLEKRWKAHKYAIKSGRGCPLLARAFNSHGAEKFSIELVEECDDDALCEREVFHIKEYGSFAPGGYNADAGGKMGGTFKGHKHTPETIERWKEKVKEQYQNEEYRKMRSEIAKAYYANPENRAKQSARMKEVAHSEEHGHKFKGRQRGNGGTMSDETKEKIRNGLNKYYEGINIEWNEEGRKKHSEIMSKVNGRKVAKYDRTGQLLQIYNTIKEAAEANNIKRTTLSSILINNRSPPGDFVWKYSNNQGLKDTSQ
jgi:group I intron endonuclease